MKWIVTFLCVFSLLFSVFIQMSAMRILVRANSLNKRAQVLEQEIGKLDRRIRKQEGIKHGFGH